MRKQKNKLAAIALMVAVVAIAVFLDYRNIIKNRLTLYQQIGDLAYQSLVKPQDQTPLPLTAHEGDSFKVPILMYHHIGNAPKGANSTRVGLTVSTENFEAQVKWLKERGFESVSLGDLYQYAEKKPVLWPAKPIIFTFDDGYSDAFDNAIPILKKYGFAGVFGIITQDAGQIQGSNSYSAWKQISEAKQAGMEIICHTQNHFDGSDPKYSAAYVYENLAGCQQEIRDRLGIAEPFLIYPYGHYTATYIEQAKKLGFNMALTVHEGKNFDLANLMRLPRIRVNNGMSLDTFAKIMEK